MPTRRYRISIRFTQDEIIGLCDAALKSGICVSALARKLLLGSTPPRSARRPSVEAVTLITLLDRLGRVASDLSVVAAALAIRSPPIMPFLERDLRKALLELRELRPAILKALGKRVAGS